MSSLKGDTLKNQYFLREIVGSGGMADVYLAWDTLRSAKMAVKVLRRDLSENPRVIQAFQKEAGFLQDLTHPYIVRFYEFGSERGIIFIVMAWVDGTDLKKRIEDLNRPLYLSEALPILQPICSALNFAHQKRLFHCDIKPSNILLHENGKDVFLADFGVAHVAREQAAGGTLPYMAPEQFSQGIVSAQTDIYSLGITVYQMLSGGVVPYHGDTKSPGSTPRERYAYEHSYLPLPPLSKFNSKLPSGVFPVIQKAASKNPAERYGSMLDFYNAFIQACGDVRVEPPKPKEDYSKTIFEIPSPPPIKPPTPQQPQPPIKPGVPHLYARSGDLSGQVVQFAGHETLIGRGANCHIRLYEKSVSRAHATILLTKRGAYIRDESSALGTYVNGNPVPRGAPIALRQGDVIQIGYYQIFEFRS
ncbi:MAG: FHA domain-containing serine/threonine-protein kinase [Anaerolineales bacterium]|nr:FHA domain-containing serine/threonine-protein kinase [Anaerolineales bacterium]